MQLILSFLSNMFEELLNIVFPIDRETEEIERMGVEKFVKIARHSPFRMSIERRYRFVDGDVYYLFSYSNDLVKQAIWQLKYRNSRRLAKFLAEVLIYELQNLFMQFSYEANLEHELPLLIPIPLSKRRREERGYNHIELLTNELMRLLPKKSFLDGSKALIKIKHTERQALISDRLKRAHNIKGCFVADPHKVQGKYIMLIDDVATTGTTLKEAAACLKATGARKVISIVIAH